MLYVEQMCYKQIKSFGAIFIIINYFVTYQPPVFSTFSHKQYVNATMLGGS